MHERTQRAVARLLFVFCCAVPTGLIIASVAITWTPWYRAHRLSQLEHTLQQETGLAIEVERCRELAPDKFKLENVQLKDPESGQLVATIGTIDWLNEDTSTRVVLHSPILRSAALGDAWQLIHDRLIRRPQHTLKPLVVVADRLTIRSSGASITHDVEVQVTPEEQGVRMHVQASDELDENSMLRCTLFRNRAGNKPTTQVSLSADTPLPCSVLSDYFPVLRRLGPDARFHGTMEFRQLPEKGWSYNFDGMTVTGISLSRVSESLPYDISGNAAVHLARCSIVPGQNVNVSGEVNVPEGGWIDWDLLEDFSNQSENDLLGVNTLVRVSAYRKVQYSKARFSVTITNERMALTGLCAQGQDYTHESQLNNIALCHYSQALAQTREWDFQSDLVTALFSPPRSEIGYWNAVLLPSPKPVRVATAPDESAGSSQNAAPHR